MLNNLKWENLSMSWWDGNSKIESIENELTFEEIKDFYSKDLYLKDDEGVALELDDIKELLSIDENLIKLLEKEFLTLEEIEEIEEHEDVVEAENCGNSGIHIDYKWYNILLKNGEEYNIYFK